MVRPNHHGLGISAESKKVLFASLEVLQPFMDFGQGVMVFFA